MYWKEVRDANLWKKIQLSFLEAMGIFVFTIFIGILNAIDLVDFTQAELLFHLHSGVIGWISLSAVTLLVWYFTGERDLDEESLIMANNVLKYMRIVVPIYVAFFYLGFTLANGEDLFRIIPGGSGSDGYYILLVIGALAASGGFLFSVYFGYLELSKIDVKTTPHYLFLGALITSTYGGIFGMILEVQNLIGESLFDVDAGQDGTAAHAAAMEAGYLFMLIAAVLEWQVIGEHLGKISRSGYIQTFALFFAGLTVSIGAGFNLEPLLMLNLPLVLLGFGLFVGRILVKIDPKSIRSTQPDRFYIPAALAMAFSVGFFLYLINTILGGKDPNDLFDSPWFIGLALTNIHLLFVGGATGVIFSCIMVAFKDADETAKIFENIGFVFMYIGLLGFAITLIYRGDLLEDGDPDGDDVRTDIAAVMGIGLYLLLHALISRYLRIARSS
ncbi:MAG: hypothetical protein ACW99Q_17240 [Candidatus Kariarchaeaceae archaeon]|jgi:hypothetical protein